jgi:diadenylate cyclase
VFEGLRHLVSLDRPVTEILRDLADILIVAFIFYRALLVMKGTRAMQMGIGFVAFGLLYIAAKYLALATLMSVLSWLASAAILILVVVFQNDIRRALARLGSRAWFTRGRDAQERLIEEVVAACTELARHRMGALICLERDANVLEFVKNDGIELDSTVTRELLVSLFIPEAVNKTHDGAVLIRNLRMARAGLFFPMPESTKVSDPNFGSRHRAAIGITEETDAIVIVTSEERGSITLFFNTNMVRNLNGQSLRDALKGLFRGEDTAGRSAFSLRRASAPPSIGPTSLRTSESMRTTSPPPGLRAAGSTSLRTAPAGSSRSSTAAVSARSSASVSGARGTETRKSEPPREKPHVAEPVVNEQPPRVSVPMPSAKDARRSAEEKPRKSDDDVSPSPVATTSVSKPMTPAELPRTSSPPGDDP